MTTLKVEWDTRPLQTPDPVFGTKIPLPGYTGQQVGSMIEAARQRAIAEGFDEFEFKWWDYCEGWVTARGKVRAAR